MLTVMENDIYGYILSHTHALSLFLSLEHKHIDIIMHPLLYIMANQHKFPKNTPFFLISSVIMLTIIENDIYGYILSHTHDLSLFLSLEHKHIGINKHACYI